MSNAVEIPILLAIDLGQIITGVLFVLYILGQLFAGREGAKAKGKPAPQRRQPVAKPQANAPNAGMPRDQADSLRAEVEEFLGRAQGQSPRKEPPQKKTPPAQRVRPAQLVRERSAPAKPRLVRAKAPTKNRDRASRDGASRDEGVAEHVARHISTSEIATHASQLGEKVGRADEQLESRLHEKFDHQLGKLQQSKTPETKASEPSNIAAEVAAMLTNPVGMRQLIIANEILRRPEW